MIIRHLDMAQVQYLRDEVVAAHELQRAQEEVAEYQAAAFQDGRRQALVEVLDMIGVSIDGQLA